MAVKAEISFHPGAYPESASPGTLVFVLFDNKTLAPVVMDRAYGVLPFRDNPNSVSTDSTPSSDSAVSIKIPSKMVRKDGKNDRSGIGMGELTRVGTVFEGNPRSFLEKLPILGQRAEMQRLKGLSDEDKKKEKIIRFAKDCIAYGTLKGKDKIDNFMKEMEESNVGLIIKDTFAALGTEAAVWAVNVPLGFAVFVLTGGDLGAAFWSGVIVQGIIRGYYVFPRAKEEMAIIRNKEEESWKHAAKVGGFGTMYGLILVTDFIPGLGSFPLPFLSAPRNTKYVLKNIELEVKKTYIKGKNLVQSVSRKVNQFFHTKNESAIV